MIIWLKNFIIMTMEIIKVENVNFHYSSNDNRDVLKNISMSVNEGETIAVVGHNGSGKSTLARLMNGLLLPSSGKIEIAGLDTAVDDNLFDIRKTVGIVFQNPDNQMVATIIEDDVAFGPENLGLDREEIGRRVDWALKSVGMEEYRKREPFKLSGGQKQRIAIAGVLAIKPRVIILDESTAMLDPAGRAEIMKVVSELKQKENISVIIITHFMDEAMTADRIVVLSDGEILFEGKPHEVFSHAEELEKIGLEVPLYARLTKKLSQCGLDLGDIENENMLVDRLCR